MEQQAFQFKTNSRKLEQKNNITMRVYNFFNKRDNATRNCEFNLKMISLEYSWKNRIGKENIWLKYKILKLS